MSKETRSNERVLVIEMPDDDEYRKTFVGALRKAGLKVELLGDGTCQVLGQMQDELDHLDEEERAVVSWLEFMVGCLEVDKYWRELLDDE